MTARSRSPINVVVSIESSSFRASSALDGTTSPTTIYAGSDLGVLRSVDGGATWTTLDARHFPNAIVTDLQLNPVARVLRASTFGRGVFEMRLRHGPRR